MKKIVVAIMVLAMMLSAMAAMAQSEKTFSITPRVAYNFATDRSTRDYVGNQWGILVDMNIASCPIGLEVGYVGARKSNSVTVPGSAAAEYQDIPADITHKAYSIPLLLTYQYPFSEQFYGLLGAGVNITNSKLTMNSIYNVATGQMVDAGVDDSKTATKFAYKIGLGYKFTPSWSVELAYGNNGKINHDCKFMENLNEYQYINTDNGIEYNQNFIQLNVGYTF